MRRKGAGHRRTRRAKGAAPGADGGELTPNQARFCELYFEHLNAAKAYRDAYPEAKPKSAESCSIRLLGNAKVKARLAALIGARSARTEITADRTLKELARLGYAEMREFVAWDARGHLVLKPSAELSADDAACVSEVKVSRGMYGDSITFKLHDKRGALELLARHQGLLKDSVPPGPFVVTFVREGSR